LKTIIATNGKSANISTIHSLEYAIYKNWLSKQDDRDFQKHIRDIEQSRLVTKLIIDYMPDIEIEQDVWRLKHFKREIIEVYMEEIYGNSLSEFD